MTGIPSQGSGAGKGNPQRRWDMLLPKFPGSWKPIIANLHALNPSPTRSLPYISTSPIVTRQMPTRSAICVCVCACKTPNSSESTLRNTRTWSWTRILAQLFFAESFMKGHPRFQLVKQRIGIRNGMKWQSPAKLRLWDKSIIRSTWTNTRARTKKKGALWCFFAAELSHGAPASTMTSIPCPCAKCDCLGNVWSKGARAQRSRGCAIGNGSNAPAPTKGGKRMNLHNGTESETASSHQLKVLPATMVITPQASYGGLFKFFNPKCHPREPLPTIPCSRAFWCLEVERRGFDFDPYRMAPWLALMTPCQWWPLQPYKTTKTTWVCLNMSEQKGGTASVMVYDYGLKPTLNKKNKTINHDHFSSS